MINQLISAEGRRYPRGTSKHIEEVLQFSTVNNNVPNFVANELEYGDGWVVLPTGGGEVPTEYLWSIREDVLANLAESGLSPLKPLGVADRVLWDRIVGTVLFEKLDFDAFEAFDFDVWTYLTVHLFWDFPNWRFPGKTFTFSEAAVSEDDPASDLENVKRPRDRVEGGLRNVLFRAWLRVYVLGPDFVVGTDIDFAGEDILDNLFGRPTISRNHQFSQAIMQTLYRNAPKKISGRHFIFREFMKAIRRRTATVNVTAIGTELEVELDKLWLASKKLVDERKNQNQN
jgi:hypothetical protein